MKIKKCRIPSEACYGIGLLLMALGTAFMNRADLGVSMVVAPAKIFSMKTGISFGWSEPILQIFLLALLCLVVRKFRPGYLFSFVTAFLYGRLLDLFLIPVGFLTIGTVWLRLLWMVLGMVITALGVAFFFHTYLAPEVYELFVGEVSRRYGVSLAKTKTWYDCGSLLVALVMTFALFGTSVFTDWQSGSFGGVGPATVICALVNGVTVAGFSTWISGHLEVFDGLPLAKYFK